MVWAVGEIRFDKIKERTACREEWPLGGLIVCASSKAACLAAALVARLAAPVPFFLRLGI